MDIIINFNTNMINNDETTILINNPFKSSDRSQTKDLNRGKHFDLSLTADDDEWYQLSNEDAIALAKRMVSQMRYIKFSPSELSKATIMKNTRKEMTYTLASPSQRMYKLFLSEYELITGGN